MKQLLVILFCVVINIQDHIVIAGEDLLGPADVSIKNIQQCENPQQYPAKIYITRRRLNRTHEVFDGNVSLSADWTDDYGLNINFAKWGNGGYKPNYYIVDEKKSCSFLMQYVAKGFKKVLRESNKAEACPVTAGTLLVKDYLVDYNELPEALIYGDFRLDMYFYRLSDGLRTSCMQLFAISKPKSLVAG